MRVSRKRRLGLLFVALLGIAIIGAACDPAPAPAPSCGPAAGVPAQIYTLLNNQRAFSGLPRLGYDCTLGNNAQSWANTMAGTGNFAHQNLSGLIASPGYSNFASLGENILVGPGNMTADAIETAWWNSPGHRANILGNFDSVGVAITIGGDGRLWAVQEFGRHF